MAQDSNFKGFGDSESVQKKKRGRPRTQTPAEPRETKKRGRPKSKTPPIDQQLNPLVSVQNSQNTEQVNDTILPKQTQDQTYSEPMEQPPNQTYCEPMEQHPNQTYPQPTQQHPNQTYPEPTEQDTTQNNYEHLEQTPTQNNYEPLEQTPTQIDNQPIKQQLYSDTLLQTPTQLDIEHLEHTKIAGHMEPNLYSETFEQKNLHNQALIQELLRQRAEVLHKHDELLEQELHTERIIQELDSETLEQPLVDNEPLVQHTDTEPMKQQHTQSYSEPIEHIPTDNQMSTQTIYTDTNTTVPEERPTGQTDTITTVPEERPTGQTDTNTTVPEECPTGQAEHKPEEQNEEYRSSTERKTQTDILQSSLTPFTDTLQSTDVTSKTIEVENQLSDQTPSQKTYNFSKIKPLVEVLEDYPQTKIQNAQQQQEQDSIQTNSTKFDLWETCISENSNNPIYRHAFRLTQHEKNLPLFDDPNNFINILNKLHPTLYIFQLEKGEITGKLHYQGYFKLTQKIRSKQLTKTLHELAYGIHVSAAVDEKAIIQYCQKQETRVKGPWSYPSDLFGRRR